MNAGSPEKLAYNNAWTPLMLCFVAGFVLLKIPTMTASLFSGHVGWSCQRNWRYGHSRTSPDTLAQLEVTMSIGKTTQPEITRAAERYLEQYGDPLGMK